MSTDPHRPTSAGADPDELAPAPSTATSDEQPSQAHEAVGSVRAEPADAEPTPTPEPEPAATLAPEPVVTPDPEPATLGTAPQPVPAADRVDDWLAEPAADAARPDPVIPTPPAFTPPGTPEDGGPIPPQVAETLQRPEVQVGLSFVGGAALSLVLKRFGR